MRIALISTPFLRVPPTMYGGTELIVYELAEGLVEAGHDVTVFATGDSKTRAKVRALYATAQWPPDPLTEMNHVSWAMKEITSGSFDLIHAHATLALGMNRLQPLPPMVYTIHHTLTQEYSRLYSFFKDVQYIAISENQKKLETRLPHCEVIHHGLDSRLYRLDKPEDYVCFVARLTEVKGPHVAVEVAGQAGVPIRVAGGVHPPDRQFYESTMKAQLNRPHVTYLDEIGLEEKAPLLSKAKALLMPLAWEEPFGLIMIEAMLSGCPVIAYPRGSVPELVENGVTGFVVNSPEEMIAVIKPGGMLESFDRFACRERAVQRFSRQRMVDHHLRLYEQVLARHGLPRNSLLHLAAVA